jgi:acyl-CoA synthetase (AMP-forming)/AMP-acid ligase II
MQPQYRTLCQVLEALDLAHGDKLALQSTTDSVSYKDLKRRSHQVAAGLAAQGVRRGDRVAFLAKNDAVYYEILFGTAAVGAVLVPINWRLASPEIAWILADSMAVTLFVGPEFEATVRAAGKDCPTLRHTVPLSDYAGWRDSNDSVPLVPTNPDDVVVQIYTSGTTGRPKGAMLSHAALLHFRSMRPEDQPEWNRWTEADVSLIVMPQFHIGGTGFGLQTICAGATGFVLDEFDVGKVLDLIENSGLSKIFTVPAAMQMILRHPRARQVDYRRIRTIVYGASPIPLALLREAMSVFGCGFVQQYGMTETCGTICALPPEDHHPDGNRRMQSAGRPLSGVEVRIVDTQGKPLPENEIGEIAIRAPTIMRGYWNKPDATARAITPDGFFLSGDAGSLDADGYLYIQDRVKDMIVSGGENIYPAEVEAVLREYPAVEDVTVIGVPDDKWGEAVKAIVVPVPGMHFQPSELIVWARDFLASYKLPKSVELIEALPRNASGKVLRRELRDPYWTDHERQIN